MRHQCCRNTMVSTPPPPAIEVLLLTTAEKTKESPAAPPEIELEIRSAPVVNTRVSLPEPPRIVEEVEATERVKVSLSAPKSIVLLEIAPFKIKLSPPEPPKIAALLMVLENNRGQILRRQTPELRFNASREVESNLANPPNTVRWRMQHRRNRIISIPTVNQRTGSLRSNNEGVVTSPTSDG